MVGNLKEKNYILVSSRPSILEGPNLICFLHLVGEINSVIYPVDGGMEDWLYAEGWDSKFLTENCQGYKELFSYLKIKATHSFPSTQHSHQVPDHPRLRNRPRKMIQNPHSSGRRQLSEVTHGNRAIVFLVETSDAKKPSTDSLGGTENILHPNSLQNGHIPRNVRLTLSAIDLLQPYTCFQSFHFNSHDNENYLNTQWYVGGGFEVSETFLALHSFSRAPVLQTTQDFTQYLRFIANDAALEKALEKTGDISQLGESKMKIVSSVMKGSTRWTFENLNNLSASTVSSDAELLKPAKLFHGKISLQQHFFPLIKSFLSANTSMKERKFSFWLIAWSKVDIDFGRVGQGYPSHLPPQSHYSNIRTNSEWNCSYVGKENARTCQGRKYWPSDFIEIEVDLIEAKVRVKKEVLDCAWWEYHSNKHSGQSLSFVLPDEWKPQDPKLNSSLNNSNNTNQKNSYRETLPTNSIESISQSSLSSIGKNNSSSFIPYHIFHLSEESSFFTVEKIYLLISLLLTIIIAAGVLIANHLRRNRIYNALVSNRYLSLPTGFQR